MTSGIAAFEAHATVGRSESRFAEFMLVGGATLVLFPIAWWVRGTFGLDASEYAVAMLAFYGAYVVNDPHFAVTYLLFYRQAWKRAVSGEQSRGYRIRYWLAGLVVPLVLASWAVIALVARSAQSLGWMVQLMYLLVGWHYVKQGFGVLSVLCARRGIRIAPRERQVILFHCFAAWAYGWASPAVAAGEFEEKGLVYGAPAHPRWLELSTGAALATSTIALVAIVLGRWRRERRTLPLAPFAGFLATIWLWTIYSSLDPLMRYLIPALHSVQYLYFVWLMRRNEARANEGPPSFGRPVAVRLTFLALSSVGLGWILFHGAPGLLDLAVAPKLHRANVGDLLGDTPFLAAIFVFVNVHHYFMDYVIWRRDNADTRFLRDATAPSSLEMLGPTWLGGRLALFDADPVSRAPGAHEVAERT